MPISRRRKGAKKRKVFNKQTAHALIKRTIESDPSAQEVRRMLKEIEALKPGCMGGLFNYLFDRQDGHTFEPDELVESIFKRAIEAAAHGSDGPKMYREFNKRFAHAMSPDFEL